MTPPLLLSSPVYPDNTAKSYGRVWQGDDSTSPRSEWWCAEDGHHRLY